jgi:hypothetical protein
LHPFLITITALAILFSTFSSKGEELDGVANYAYAVFTGTGKYNLGDRDIYIFNMPLEFNINEVDYDSGDRVGLRLLASLAVGITDFETIDELPDISVDDLQTFSFVPGVEIPVALNDHWQIKPFFQLGYGVDMKSDSRSFIWGTGVRTSAKYGESSKWIIGGEFLWAGNNPNGDDPTTSFSRLGVGFEYKILTNWTVFDRHVSWHVRGIHWNYTNAVDFEAPVVPFKLNRSNEIGLSFGLSRPINMLGYGFTQLGIGYEKADGYDAIKFFTTFPF